MSAAHPEPIAILRGTAVGALSAGLAFAAHGMGGGPAPPPSALVLLLIVCAGLGAVVASIPAHRHGRMYLTAALGAGQLLGHVALSATAHAHSAVPPVAMLLAHTAAAVLCAALVAGAERLYWPMVRVLRVILRNPTPLTPHGPSPVLVPVHSDPVDALLRVSISRRGPPVRI
ncbi:hypothetical protein [Rhodococcus sp. NPDC058521]|uniref:hypothetical protein n=1 Tax=Rhodococcus sp. NPDC058521 TaxID=3346536 RepID=UPI00365CE2FB